MGTRGPQKTPTEIAKLRGRDARKLPRREPKPAVSAPPMPGGISKPAKEHWKHVTEECVRLKLTTTLDYAILCQYIEEWDAMRELTAKCRKLGMTLTEETRDGIRTKRAPWDMARCQHAPILRGLIRDLGFSPSARASVSTVEDEETKLASLLAFDGGREKKP